MTRPVCAIVGGGEGLGRALGSSFSPPMPEGRPNSKALSRNDTYLGGWEFEVGCA